MPAYQGVESCARTSGRCTAVAGNQANLPMMSLVRRIKETVEPNGQDLGPVWRICPLETTGSNGHSEERASSSGIASDRMTSVVSPSRVASPSRSIVVKPKGCGACPWHLRSRFYSERHRSPHSVRKSAIAEHPATAVPRPLYALRECQHIWTPAPPSPHRTAREGSQPRSVDLKPLPLALCSHRRLRACCPHSIDRRSNERARWLQELCR